MTVGRLVRRGVRHVARWWWSWARPSTRATLAGSGAPARPVHETGRAPRSDERWLPTTPASGPWVGVDPHETGPWPHRASMLAVLLWGALVGWRVRRDIRGR